MKGGYQQLYVERVMQANPGADLDFLTGCRGHGSRANRIESLLQRAMRAEPPRITASTSGSVAMLVSPGVVMASAPCATPHWTAHSCTFAGKQSIDQAGSERVATADSVQNL